MTGWTLVKRDLLSFLPTLSGLDVAGAVTSGASLSGSGFTGYAEVAGNGDDESGGYYEQDYDSVDGLVAETGEVYVRLVARSGDTDLDALQDQIDAWVTSLRQHYRADKTLGGALMQSSTVSVGRCDVEQGQTDKGGLARNTVAVRYQTRL